MNIQQALTQANQRLRDSSPSPLLDAQVLLKHVLHCSSAHLIAWPEKELEQSQLSSYLQLIEKRHQGLPVAHLTGNREFWSLNFFTDNSTLIPRPETETLIEFILEKFGSSDDLKLLDMGTGSGAIAISIAHEKPGWNISASDVSEQAIALAKKNCTRHSVGNIQFFVSDWLRDIPEQLFDVIVSNPPYIAEDDPHLLQGDLRFEPQSALSSGKAGMDDIELICSHIKSYLPQNGCLIVEHGYNQAKLVADCFSKNGFGQIIQKQDLAGHTRMTAGSKL